MKSRLCFFAALLTLAAFCATAAAQDPTPSLADRARQERERKKAAPSTSRVVVSNENLRKDLPGEDHPEMQARFDLPKGWTPGINYRNQSVDLVCPEYVHRPASCRLWINSRELNGPITDNGKSEFDKARRIVSNLSQYLPTVVPWHETELAGLPAAEVIRESGESTPTEYRERLVYVVSPQLKRMYLLSITAPRSQFEKYNEIFEQVLQSFRPIP